jgi:predicted nucleic acid-binding Zn finger protein
MDTYDFCVNWVAMVFGIMNFALFEWPFRSIFLVVGGESDYLVEKQLMHNSCAHIVQKYKHMGYNS